MPELPEVETIKRGLSRLILHKTITNIEIRSDKSFIGDPAQLKNREIIGISRRGKALLIELSGDLWLMIHLRMTGQLIFIGNNTEKFAAGHPDASFTAEMPGRHTRVIFTLSDGSHLYFNDQRKFGFVKVATSTELATDPFLKKLAPEPWDLSPADFIQRIQRHKNTTIKAAILDQTIIAGVGNIYADESLFFARIHPATKVADIPPEKLAKLLTGITKVMDESINSGGSTLKDYVQADGSKGDYLNKFAKVFNRQGQACPTCGTTIQKARVAGRGTHFCPECQPL